MKKAFSRKNLWEHVPASAKTTLAAVVGRIPPAYILGRGFRRNLQFVEAAEWWSAEQTRAYQLAALKRMCTRAYERTPYYRQTFTDAKFDPNALTDVRELQQVPTINKGTLQEHLPDMMATSVRASGVDFASTGGTSGEPLHFYINANRSEIEYAYLLASWRRAGFALGQTLAVLRGRIVRADSRGLYHEYDPILRSHYYSNFHMTDENMARYLEHMAHIGPCFLHVYPSSASALAAFIRRSGTELPVNILGILAESEIAYPDQRQLIEDTFKRRMFSSYGLTEKVVAAAECEKSSNYHVWPTYGFFELLDANGRVITTPGERGEIVGTGFINTVVPFIRYRTGDFATYVSDRCEACGRAHPVIADIRGHRTQELLVAADGSCISWTALNMHDDTFDRVLRFQFHQEVPGRAVLNVVPAPGFSTDDRRRITRRLEAKMGDRISLTLDLVADIPRSVSGKAIYVDQRIAGLDRSGADAPGTQIVRTA